jgi:hypothetical protein
VEYGRALPQLGRRGLSIAAIAGVDVALWDILGKSLDSPVWRLLGGRRVERMPAYASGGWADAANIGPQLQSYCDKAGFRAVKMRVGVMDGSPAGSAERVRAAREHLGPDVKLMADAHGTWTVAEARAFCRMVEDCDLFWFEEPVNADDKRGLAEVRACSTVPISTGESEFTRHDFREICEFAPRTCCSRPSPSPGGITRDCGSPRSPRHSTCASHRICGSGAPAFRGGLHLAFSRPSGFILEYSLGHNPMLHDLSRGESSPWMDGTWRFRPRPGSASQSGSPSSTSTEYGMKIARSRPSRPSFPVPPGGGVALGCRARGEARRRGGEGHHR